MATTAFTLVVTTALHASFCAHMIAAASSTSTAGASTFTCIARMKSLSLVLPSAPGVGKRPAVTTSSSMPPYASVTSSSMRRTAARSVASQESAIAGPHAEMPLPATPIPVPTDFSRSFAALSALFGSRSTHATHASSAVKCAPVTRPMPLPAPTITETCPASGFGFGIRCSFASSRRQYSMSNASCRGSAR